MGQCKTYFSGLKTAFYTSNPSPTWQTGIPMTWPLTMLKYWTKMKLSNQIIVPKGLNLGTLWYQVSIKSNCIDFLNNIKNNVLEFSLFIFHLFTVQNDQLLTTYDLGNGPTTIISPDNIVDGTLHDISIIISPTQMFNSSAEREGHFFNWTCAVNIDDHEGSTVSSFNNNDVINRVITQRKKIIWI